MNQPATWTAILKTRACRNKAARVTQEPDGTMAVHVKNIRPGYMIPPISWLVPFKPERRVALDSIGSYVWSQCDGVRTMEELIDMFSARYQLTFHEARAAITQYVQSLVQRGVLAMILPTDDAGGTR